MKGISSVARVSNLAAVVVLVGLPVVSVWARSDTLDPGKSVVGVATAMVGEALGATGPAPGQAPAGRVIGRRWGGPQPAGPACATLRGTAASTRILIAKVGIDLDVLEGSPPSVPNDIEVAWHYPGTSQPGGQGNTFIYAHNFGRPRNSAAGLFNPIHQLGPGDHVCIALAGGSSIDYAVESVAPRWPVQDTRPLAQSGDERLTLMTCNGTADDGTRFIVVAERVDPPARPVAIDSRGGGGEATAASPGPGPSPSASPGILPLPFPGQ
jgi:LPXTG-site transpeptidase (sortase) family protein